MSTVIEQTPTLTKYRPLGFNAKKVARKRYSVKNLQGTPIEEWTDIVTRVVDHVSKAEPDETKRAVFQRAMSKIMLNREFLPNTPAWLTPVVTTDNSLLVLYWQFQIH